MKKTIGTYKTEKKIEIEKNIYRGFASWYVFDGGALCREVKTEEEAKDIAKKMLSNKNTREEILDDEPITPTESYIFIALLDKVINQVDMDKMEIRKKAISLKNEIENS